MNVRSNGCPTRILPTMYVALVAYARAAGARNHNEAGAVARQAFDQAKLEVGHEPSFESCAHRIDLVTRARS